MEDVAQLEQAFGPEAREEGLEGRSDAKMRNLAQEVGAMVFLLYRVCLGTQSSGQISSFALFMVVNTNLWIRRANHGHVSGLKLMSLLLSGRTGFPDTRYFNSSACGQTIRGSDRIRSPRKQIKLRVGAQRWTYSAA